MANNKVLYLLDAYALIFRAYFAFGKRPLVNSKGLNVSAIQGFTNTLHDLITQEKPTHIAVVFDHKSPTFRKQEYDFYKANRQETPEDIKLAEPYIRKIIKGFNVPILETPGYEADDVIGTLAKRAAQDGFDVYMVTPDKDFGQLVAHNIFIYKPSYQKKPKELIGIKEVLEKWNIARVDQVIDVLGLMGDAVDNIPGIKGVGQKTAAKLLKKYDTVEGIIANIDKLSGRLKEKVQAGVEDAIISKKLATIVIDVPVDYQPETFKVEPINKEVLSNIFADLEFRTLGKRILGDDYQVNNTGHTAKRGQLNLFDQVNTINAALMPTDVAKGRSAENTQHKYLLVNTSAARADLLNDLLTQTLVCFDTETTSIDANNAELVGLAFAYEKNNAFYVPIPANKSEAQTIVNEFLPFFNNEKIAKLGQNIKYDMLVLKWYGVTIKGILHDTMLAHYLIEPDLKHNLNYLSETYLHYSPIPIERLIGKKGKSQKNMRDIAPERVVEYAGEDADITLQLHHHFIPSIKENLNKLYSEVEMPLVPVLTDMEYEGINLDVDFLSNFSGELREELLHIEDNIYQAAGIKFNINSTQQLGDVLFNKLGIPYKGKKTKTGRYSTNEAVLSELASEHAIINDLLTFREISKLRNTYVDALPQLINTKTGRIHTTFNQAVAATGRLSSANPNLQNIPIRTERGREMRKAFIPRSSEYTLLAADYSQIELRLMAEMSQDENMLLAFTNGLDIHRATAARVYGVAFEEVDSTMRRNAKMVNFGIIYGISAHGLAQRLGIARGEASNIIKQYFAQYPQVKTYMDTAIDKAKKTGYAETLLGRRRYLKDITSKNYTVRQFAERNAINTPIQGSAADMIKLAMIKIHQQMKAANMQSRMLLQVHDELIFDAHLSELEALQTLVVEGMKNALPSLSVPIEVGMGTGVNWLEAH